MKNKKIDILPRFACASLRSISCTRKFIISMGLFSFTLDHARSLEFSKYEYLLKFVMLKNSMAYQLSLTSLDDGGKPFSCFVFELNMRKLISERKFDIMPWQSSSLTAPTLAMIEVPMPLLTEKLPFLSTSSDSQRNQKYCQSHMSTKIAIKMRVFRSADSDWN